MKLFNHDIRRIAPARYNLSWLYCSRALCLTDPEDIIQLPAELKPHFPFILEHYKSIGLKCSEKVIWDLDLRNVAMPPDLDLSSFYFGEIENNIRPDPPRFKITEFLNSKNRFIELAKQKGIPVPKTVCADSVAALNFDMDTLHGPVYFKPAISTSGIGITRFRDVPSLLSKLPELGNWGPFQIQEEVCADLFLSVQYQENERKARRLLISDQILNGNSHVGNICPSHLTDVGFLDELAQKLVTAGMREVFGFDIAVKMNGENTQFFALECNPRFTAATYPTLLANRLDIKNWKSINIDTRLRDFNQLQIQDLEYRASQACGIVIINWGTIVHGNLMLMIAGDRSQQESLTSEVAKRLGML